MKAPKQKSNVILSEVAHAHFMSNAVEGLAVVFPAKKPL
jgi:hypothetical protein